MNSMNTAYGFFLPPRSLFSSQMLLGTPGDEAALGFDSNLSAHRKHQVPGSIMNDLYFILKCYRTAYHSKPWRFSAWEFLAKWPFLLPLLNKNLQPWFSYSVSTLAIFTNLSAPDHKYNRKYSLWSSARLAYVDSFQCCCHVTLKNLYLLLSLYPSTLSSFWKCREKERVACLPEVKKHTPKTSLLCVTVSMKLLHLSTQVFFFWFYMQGCLYLKETEQIPVCLT